MPDDAIVMPHLRPDALVVAPPGEALSIALSAHSEVLVTSPPPGLAAWLGGLDGTRTSEDQLLAAPLPRPAAQSLLLQLQRAGVLLDAARGRVFRDAGRAHRDALAVAATSRNGRARDPQAPPTRIGVLGRGALPDTLGQAIAGCPGLTLADQAECELAVLVTDPFDPRTAERADVVASHGLPSVCLAASAVDAALSPVSVPGRSPCWRCWMLDVGHRRMGARARLDGAIWGLPGRSPAAPRLPAHHRALVAAVALEHVLRSLELLAPGAPATIPGIERLVDLRRLTVSVRPVAMHPACGCSSSAVANADCRTVQRASH